MPRRKRTDVGHQQIRDALRRLGCDVADTSQHGLPLLDLLVIHRGRAYLVEVKSKRGKLSPEQADLIARTDCAVIMRSVEDAILFLNDYNSLRQRSLKQLP